MGQLPLKGVKGKLLAFFKCFYEISVKMVLTNNVTFYLFTFSDKMGELSSK